MEKLSSIPWNVSPMISSIPTLAAFHPLLEKNRPFINLVPKKTFKYGGTDRHYLDIYYPPSQTDHSGSLTPVLFFVYGGGFITGARTRPSPDDLIYGCVGSFFARQGFITVIPDYRLAPDFKYPSPVEDVIQAIQWILSYESNLVTETTPNPDLESLFVMGHSAGAAHVATLILHPTLIPVDSDLRRRIKGVFPVSCPFHYQYDDGIFEAYYGSEENARSNSPLLLLLQSFDRLPKEELRKLLLVEAQYEPEWIMNLGVDTRRVLEWHIGEPVTMDVVQVHNHTSLVVALSSGEGEEWGVRTADRMKSILRRPTVADGADILKDIEENELFKCPRCQQQKSRSFSIKIDSEIMKSRTFIVCGNCQNKWME